METFYLHSPTNIGWFYLVMITAITVLVMSLRFQQKRKTRSAVWKYATYPGVGFAIVAMIWGCVFVYQQSHATVTVSPGERFTIHAGIGSPDLEWQQMDIAAARIMNPYEENGYRPVRRRFGTGMKGFISGWFLLSNGKKAFVTLVGTAPADRTVMIPVNDEEGGYIILLSMHDEADFMSLIKNKAPE